MQVSGRVSTILAKKKASTVWSIAPNAMVFDAIQLMDDKNVGALPVLHNGALVGIVSERDYTRKVILKGRSSKETPVSDIMTGQLLTVNPSQSITECMRIMTEKRVRHLPVPAVIPTARSDANEHQHRQPETTFNRCRPPIQPGQGDGEANRVDRHALRHQAPGNDKFSKA